MCIITSISSLYSFPYFITYLVLTINLNSKICKFINISNWLCPIIYCCAILSFPLTVFMYLVFDWFTISPAYLASFSSVRNISFKAIGVLVMITKSPAYAHSCANFVLTCFHYHATVFTVLIPMT